MVALWSLCGRVENDSTCVRCEVFGAAGGDAYSRAAQRCGHQRQGHGGVAISLDVGAVEFSFRPEDG